MPWSRASFGLEVVKLYRNLYDLVYLRTHPLADVFVSDPSVSSKNKGWQVHHLLVDAIEELNPGTDVPVFSAQWRRYQLLALRFIDGLKPQQVARQLTISLRQYFREQKAALETVADILWGRYVTSDARIEPAPCVEDAASLERLELLRLEAARVAQAERYSRVDEVLRGVLPVLAPMMQQHELTLNDTLSASGCAVSVDRNLLRQMLLGMVGYLVNSSRGGTIHLTSRLEAATLSVTASVVPPSAVLAGARCDAEDTLFSLREIATLAGVGILPVRTGGSVVGFRLQLPTAHRTILVVDDNGDTLALMERHLNALHYRAVAVQTAGEALEQARRVQPEAITLDLMMPGQDGWDLLQSLSNDPGTRHIPIIVCSVLRQKALALSLGASAFLEKPVSAEALRRVLEALEKP